MIPQIDKKIEELLLYENVDIFRTFIKIVYFEMRTEISKNIRYKHRIRIEKGIKIEMLMRRVIGKDLLLTT